MSDLNEQTNQQDEIICADLVNEIREMSSFAKYHIGRFRNLIKIGTALSGEKDHDRLLGMIVDEAKRYTNADGCTLYIKDEKKACLNFKVVRNDSLNIRMGGAGDEITWSPVSLVDENGVENHGNVSAHCALSGIPTNIADVYDVDFDFQGTKDFDATTGYRSKSMLVIPMRDHEGEIVGVIQLLNALDRLTGEVVGFAENEIGIVSSLASQAAIAITNSRLIQGLEDLLYSIIKMVAAAIDEKSPYTSGHVQNVAVITENLAEAISLDNSGAFKNVTFSKAELEEIRLAAWLHDVGKIVTPEYVVDKATKLETIFDRIELVKYRLALLKKDAEISRLKRRLAELGDEVGSEGADSSAVNLGGAQEIDGTLAFLESVNIGGEFLDDESLQRIEKLASLEYEICGEIRRLLNEDEVNNLSIRKGTLTQAERDIINNHASLTTKMLGALPFPRKFAQIPVFAGMHHEKLDGSGYPDGLHEDEIPLQARILAVADIFEALTAADRPYKEGKKLSESMRIMGFMVKDNHIDSDICNIMVESGLVAKYAKKNLPERQQDNFQWNGKMYGLKGVWNGQERRRGGVR